MTETPATGKPALTRRLAAIAAIVLVVAVLAATLAVVIREPLRSLAQALLLVVVGLAAWEALTRRGALRWLGVAVAVAAVAAIVIFEVQKDGNVGVSLVLRVAGLLVAAGLARYALARDLRTLQRSATPGTPAPAARRRSSPGLADAEVTVM